MKLIQLNIDPDMPDRVVFQLERPGRALGETLMKFSDWSNLYMGFVREFQEKYNPRYCSMLQFGNMIQFTFERRVDAIRFKLEHS